MKKNIALLICWFFIQMQIKSQVMIELGPARNARDAFSSINVYGSDGLRKGINYHDIKGSPFWSEEWHPATLFDTSNASFGRYQVKVNLAEQAVHFLGKNQQELVPVDDIVMKIIIYSKTDSTKIETVFTKNVPHIHKLTKLKNYYVQEMNQGKVKFLAIKIRKVESADSLFGTLKRYYFSDVNEYYLQIDERVERIKKLNKDALVYFLPAASGHEGWIKEKKLNLKKEEDFIQFINYYNTVEK